MGIASPRFLAVRQTCIKRTAVIRAAGSSWSLGGVTSHAGAHHLEVQLHVCSLSTNHSTKVQHATNLKTSFLTSRESHIEIKAKQSYLIVLFTLPSNRRNASSKSPQSHGSPRNPDGNMLTIPSNSATKPSHQLKLPPPAKPSNRSTANYAKRDTAA